jgi:hypothetical protein
MSSSLPLGYWSSTTFATNTNGAWVVWFNRGNTSFSGKTNDSEYFVRAIRVVEHSVLSVSPASRNVAKDAGSTTFSVSNTGTGTMSWNAKVTSDSGWFSIISGDSGINSGTINCIFLENTSASARTATIQVTAIGAGSPVNVTVTQAGQECTATLDGKLLLHIPYLSYINPMLGAITFWADFVYQLNPSSILFKLKDFGAIEHPSYLCTPPTLSDDLTIHIPNVQLSDGITHLWVDLKYDSALSTDVNLYFFVKDYGVLTN